MIDGFETRKSSVPVEVHSFRTNEGKIERISNGNILGIGDDVEIAWGKNPSFISTSTSYKNYPSLKKGFSNNWLYYHLT